MSAITGILLIKHLHWVNSTFTKILKPDICTRKCVTKQDSEIKCTNLVKYSCKFQPTVFTLTYRDIIERRMRNILNFSPYFSTTPSSVDGYNSQKRHRNYSLKIVNKEIFIPNLIKNFSCYDNKKFTRRNICHIKTS